MKILTVLATFPPHSYGGAEISALNLSKWMLAQGHEVAVITTADKNEPELHGDKVDGLKVWRLRFPRPYTFRNHVKASKWLKPLWYLQDHFDPRNHSLMGSVLDAYKPDIISIHAPAGIGYNGLRAIGQRNIPTAYFLHDLALACLWGGMFKNGKICTRQCPECRIVSHIRFSAAASIPHIGFCSPSRANLKTAASFLPLAKHKTAAIFNANTYPTPNVTRTMSKDVRFLYVGRLHETKGVSFLLTILEKLSESYRFTIDLLGEGPEAEALRSRFAHHPWCRLKGHVSQQEVANAMAESDVLCTPSIWPEPLGGVVVQALMLGLPVLGSAIGGIPELIEHGKSGRLIPANDAPAWEREIVSVLSNPAQLEVWGAYAKTNAQKFDHNVSGRRILSFMNEIIAEAKDAETAR